MRQLFATLALVLAASYGVAVQTPQFDVASIKPASENATGSGMRTLPDGTFIATNTPISSFLGSAYPSEDRQYRNLPEWAQRERYDVTVKPPAGAPRALVQSMWRHFFSERMKLQVHEETRETPIYLLMVARDDGRLGPQLNPAGRDCAAEAAAARDANPPAPSRIPTEEETMASCRVLFGQGRIVSGGTLLRMIVPSLSSMVGRPIEDRTNLIDYYRFTLTFAPRRNTPSPATATDPADAPDISTALREQLGLKLEPSSKSMTTIVVDHIERPTAN
jgi:bla regulator protein blaR1